ncbi:MAG: hypothetical protein OXI87_01635 [Albidovulum sp.]|nr:hypothetical protein [Albidovulum sp.]
MSGVGVLGGNLLGRSDARMIKVRSDSEQIGNPFASRPADLEKLQIPTGWILVATNVQLVEIGKRAWGSFLREFASRSISMGGGKEIALLFLMRSGDGWLGTLACGATATSRR